MKLNFPLSIPIESLLDYGVFIRSSYVNEFYNYAEPDFSYEDLSRPSSHGLLNNPDRLIFSENKSLNPATSLAYDLNCLPSLEMQSGVKFW